MESIPEFSPSSSVVPLAVKANRATTIVPPDDPPVRLSCLDEEAEQIPVFVVGEEALIGIDRDVTLRAGQVAVVPQGAVRARVTAKTETLDLPLASGLAHRLRWQDGALAVATTGASGN